MYAAYYNDWIPTLLAAAGLSEGVAGLTLIQKSAETLKKETFIAGVFVLFLSYLTFELMLLFGTF